MDSLENLMGQGGEIEKMVGMRMVGMRMVGMRMVGILTVDGDKT